MEIVSEGGTGSGFVLHNSGLIVTCYHCIADTRFAIVEFANGTRAPVLGVVKASPQADIAILVYTYD